MTDSEPGMEVPKTEPVEKGSTSQFEVLKREITERMDFYIDTSNSYDREEISLIMDVLDKARLTLHDLTDDELAKLDALEKRLFRQYLPEDYKDNDDDNKEIDNE